LRPFVYANGKIITATNNDFFFPLWLGSVSTRREQWKLTEDIETGDEEGDFEEAVTKESKEEAGDHQDNGDNGSRDSDLCDIYCSGKEGGRDIV
jgi:hypothetical protein